MLTLNGKTNHSYFQSAMELTPLIDSAQQVQRPPAKEKFLLDLRNLFLSLGFSVLRIEFILRALAPERKNKQKSILSLV